jgi:mannonate dehydratase
LYAQYRFYLNAACVDPALKNVDRDYLLRLRALMADFPAGMKSMVMAFDRTHDEAGRPQPERSAFYLPNTYARDIAAAHGARIAWVASIHPYRQDTAEAVADVVRQGALAVKWLPPAMGIDPASPLCNRFYDAMVKHDLPLITHGGEERAVEGAHRPAFGNVLRLRRPLERGVRVVVAHCASMGRDVDLDAGSTGAEVECFQLFERLMATREFDGRLFGDISALPQTNRFAYLERILKHREWAGRLVNGSDYPLPGVFPLFSVDAFVERNWLKAEVGEHLKQVREGNPLLFDFLLKRHLQIDGLKFGNDVFETARVFRRATA